MAGGVPAVRGLASDTLRTLAGEERFAEVASSLLYAENYQDRLWACSVLHSIAEQAAKDTSTVGAGLALLAVRRVAPKINDRDHRVQKAALQLMIWAADGEVLGKVGEGTSLQYVISRPSSLPEALFVPPLSPQPLHSLRGTGGQICLLCHVLHTLHMH